METEHFQLGIEHFQLKTEYFNLEMNRIEPLKRPNNGQNRGLTASRTGIYFENRHFRRFSPRTGLGFP